MVQQHDQLLALYDRSDKCVQKYIANIRTAGLEDPIEAYNSMVPMRIESSAAAGAPVVPEKQGSMRYLPAQLLDVPKNVGQWFQDFGDPKKPVPEGESGRARFRPMVRGRRRPVFIP